LARVEQYAKTMRILLVVAALPFLGCRAPVADDVTADGDAAAGGDATGGGDAGTDAAGLLIQQAFGGASGEVAAQVPLLEPGAGPQETCDAPVDAGACQLTSCVLGGIGSPGPGYGDFGTLSASVGATTVPITYGGTGYGTVYFPPGVTLGTGGTMAFRGGPGPGVPSFDVVATIPGLAVITSPVPMTDGGAATLDTSQDLSVTWSPISIGQINFGLNGGSNSSPGRVVVSLACTFDGASGSGVVPQALLSSLKETSGSSPAYATVDSELTTTTVVDGLTIVTQSYQNSPNAISSFDVVLQ
jgi:hypothetical protein